MALRLKFLRKMVATLNIYKQVVAMAEVTVSKKGGGYGEKSRKMWFLWLMKINFDEANKFMVDQLEIIVLTT